tara:strand:+ start:261 stop:695 length:435 start_codon:yes stop_codon:yes gene_type:complete
MAGYFFSSLIKLITGTRYENNDDWISSGFLAVPRSLLVSSILTYFKLKRRNKMSSLAIGDYSTIAEMDPSVADGFRVIYDREVGGFQPTPVFIAFWLFILLVVASCRKNTPNLNCISIFLSLPTQHDLPTIKFSLDDYSVVHTI